MRALVASMLLSTASALLIGAAPVTPPRAAVATMGLFDNIKPPDFKAPELKMPNIGLPGGLAEAFENEPKLAAKRKAENARSAKGYVQKKVQRRQQYEKDIKTRNPKKQGDINTGNAVVDEIFSGWTWK